MSIVDFLKVKLSDVRLQANFDITQIQVLYGNNKFKVRTPILTLPFGIDSVKDAYYGKLEFSNHTNDSEVMDFFNLMKGCEKFISDYILTIDKDAIIQSNLVEKEGFSPEMIIKLIQFKGKITTKIMDKTSKYLTFMDIKKKSKVKCVLLLDGIWKVNGKYCYKWKAQEILIV